MAKFSKKVAGKEVGQAEVYAQPHGVTAGKYGYQTDPNSMSSVESTPGGMPARRVSGGNPNRNDVKTDGIKIRGTGAATKGVKARGPMA
jgi:hypothetical protein